MGENNFMDLCSYTFCQLKDVVTELGEKPFRAKQIFDAIYKNGCEDILGVTTLSKNLREMFNGKLKFPLLTLKHKQESIDKQTVKFLWQLYDGNFVESVLISSGTRRTLCVSSQVGCRAKCSFCASGKYGFVRNLRTAEIVEQVVRADNILKKKDESISHIVFMGMGEPLLNYDAVVGSIKVLLDEEGMNFSKRKITVSTVGVVEGIEKLSREDVAVNLVLSLHAPNQEIRQKIMPYARKYPLNEIMPSMENYFYRTKRNITYEYLLLAGINDSEDNAKELAMLLERKQCTVNLIPYNPVVNAFNNYRRPRREVIERFKGVLEKRGVNTTWRYTKGKDIDAACGQLALKQKTK
jgi:23S rRNA (adenine2503-C2)-methyltransferase